MNVIERINHDFDQLVRDMPKQQLLDEFGMMCERMKQQRALAGAKVLPTYIKPFFLTLSQMRYYRDTVETVLGCQEKLIELYYHSAEHRALYELTPTEVPLVEISARLPRKIYFSRMDTIMYGANAEDFMFLEFNCDSPGGAYFADIQVESLLEFSVLKKLGATYTYINEPYRPKALTALLTAWWQAGGRKEPRIAVVGNPAVTNVEEFKLYAEYFAAHGYHGLFTDPWSLEYDGEKLTKDGQQIDMIYRRGVLSDYSRHVAESKPVVDAYRDGNVLFVNPLNAKLGDNKNLLALLTDPQIQFLFDDHERKVLARHIPWTRLLREGRTSFQDREIELLPFVRANKELLVIKPNSQFGGKGVVIGPEASQAAWDTAIEEAATEQKVVQRYVPIPQMEFPVFTQNGVEFQRKKVNHNFFTFAGSFGGGFCRTSDSSIINISAGGALVTFFVIKD